jgi:hypothetical protein
MTARNTNHHLHEIAPKTGVHAAELHSSFSATDGSDGFASHAFSHADPVHRRRSSFLSSDMRRKIRLWLDERDFYSLFAIIGVVFVILLLIVFVTDFGGPRPSRL